MPAEAQADVSPSTEDGARAERLKGPGLAQTLGMSRTSLVLTLVFFQLESLGYLLVNRLSMLRRSIALMTAGDEVVRFRPKSLWLYVSLLPYCFFVMLDVAPLRRLLRGAVCVFLTSLISFRSFLKQPSCYPRPPLESEEGRLGKAWVTLRNVDLPSNTFPSLHVGHTVLLSFLLSRHLPKERSDAYVLWAMLLSLSTLTTKQHYVVDITGGILVAETIAQHIYEPWEDRRLSWRTALLELRRLCRRLDALALTPEAYRLPAAERHPSLQHLLEDFARCRTLSETYTHTQGRFLLLERKQLLVNVLNNVRPPLSRLLALLPGWLQFLREFQEATPRLTDASLRSYVGEFDEDFTKGMELLFDFSAVRAEAAGRTLPAGPTATGG